MRKIILALVVVSYLGACAMQSEKKEHTSSPYNDSIAAVYHTTDSIIQLENKYTFPKPIGRINDFDSLLNLDTKLRLSTIIKAHQEKTTNEIAIITVDDTGPYKENLDVYTYHLANEWGVGKKEKDNGVIIAISQRLHKMRISVGKGLEDVLPNAECKRIIDTIMIPEFKKGDYDAGIEKGLLEIIRILEN